MVKIPDRFRTKSKIPERYRKKRSLPLDIDSTAIAEATWKSNGDLFITFVRDGSQYIFHDVPKSVAEDFEADDSQGQFFNDFIRDEYDYD